MNLKKHLPKLLLLLPLVVGTVGFALLEGETVVNGAFACVTMYFLNYTDTPPNLLVGIARWTAPLMTASGAALAVNAVRRRFSDSLRCLRKNSTGVYGPEGEKAVFLTQLGRDGVDGQEDRLVPAKRYILTGPEEESFAFYTRHREKMAGKPVYLQCRSLPGQAAKDADLHFFSPEENAARLFWTELELYELSARAEHRAKVALVGFGKLGEEVLTQGLLLNIFHPAQHWEYHIFGDGSAYTALHTQLGELEDRVVFHPTPWYEGLGVLEEADMVVVLEQEEQTALLGQILRATTAGNIHVFTAPGLAAGVLDGGERLTLFDWSKGYDTELIFGETLLERAKRLHLRYSHLYGGAEETGENKEALWRELDAFTRYSNLSAADYHTTRRKMLKAMGLSVDGTGLSEEQKTFFAHLEHMRWSRYHYLQNWRFGQPENGKRKDAARRVHADLRPFGELSEGEQKKDWEAIEVLCALGK